MDKNSSASKAGSSSAGRGNREDKARSASGHTGKDYSKARSSSSSSTSGHPHPHPIKGKDENKAPRSSSTVDNTNACTAATNGVPILIKSILKEAMLESDVEEITVEFLDTQIEHIAQQIQLRKAQRKPNDNLSSLVLKLNMSFSERMSNSGWKPEVSPHKLPPIGDIRPMAIVLLEILGKLPSSFAGLLIVADVLRRFDKVSRNKAECLEVVKDINMLARIVIDLKPQVTPSSKEMEATVQESRQLILQGSILCCTILESSKIFKLFKASAQKDELTLLRGEVDRNYKQLMGKLHIETLKGVSNLQSAADRKRVRWPLEIQDLSPAHAVGIEGQLKKVIELLDWKSDGKPVAVIVHGFAGLGKTTLADAAFSKIFQENYTCSTNICNYSKIRLCEDTESSSDIKSLQTIIRKDLMGDDDTKGEVIRNWDHGRQEIGKILRKESAFLYIDNVLSKERLEQLLPLPATLEKAKKLRLLITARDKGITTVLQPNILCKFHEVPPMSSSKANRLLTNAMGTGKIDKSVVDEIVQTSGGVPLILKVIGQFIAAEEDKQKACKMFREERENWRGQIFDGLDIAYRHMPEDLKDPFLDICSFFNGWYWDAVEDIVGISTMNSLQKRGLLTKDRNSDVTIHDVILRIVLQKSKGTRIMDAKEISQVWKRKDRKVIKGLWFTEDQGLQPTSAIKLDQVASSLRVLSLENLKLEGDYNENFLELIYLDAGMNPLPSNVSAFEKLRYLSYLPQKPKDLILSQMPSEMKRLKLNGKLYSRLFRGCSLDLHGLQNLRVLKLLQFQHLKNLPEEFASLKCLQVLKISDCDGFEELPTRLGDLNQMLSLTVEKCPKLRKLPESISKLTSLKFLQLSHCASLRQLPEDFGSLSSLLKLDLKGTDLKMLPASRFAELSSLSRLDLSSCKKLQGLCKDFHSLPSLKYLALSSCPMLEGKWMDVIKMVKTIWEVDIRKSEQLVRKWQGIRDPPRTFSVRIK